jgi:hypothetical protein
MNKFTYYDNIKDENGIEFNICFQIVTRKNKLKLIESLQNKAVSYAQKFIKFRNSNILPKVFNFSNTNLEFNNLISLDKCLDGTIENHIHQSKNWNIIKYD